MSEVRHVILSDHLGDCHVFSDFNRDAQLIKSQVWVGSDDRASRKIYTLTHKVASQTTLFSLESRTDSLNRLPRLVLLCTSALNVIIHHSCYVKLEHLSLLSNNCLGVTCSYGAFYLVVLFNHLLVGKGQVIFASGSAAAHCDGGAYRRWGNSEILDNHVRRV